MYEDCESFTKDRSGANNKALDGSGNAASAAAYSDTDLDTDIVRFGVVGVGNIGSAHTACLARGAIHGARLAAICDIDTAKEAYLREKYPDIPFFINADEMLESGLCDAVIVSAPHKEHVPVGMAALEHGLNLLTEKPAGIRVSDVRLLNEKARLSGKVFGIMFNQRTNPLFQKARDIFRSGGIGELKRVSWIITNWYRTQQYYNSGDWRATWSGEGGGVLLNQAPHNLDILQWICGMPAKMRAFCYEGKFHNIEVEDEASLYFEYENGATGVFITSTGEYPGTNRLEISGTNGKMVLEDGKIKLYTTSISEREFCFSVKNDALLPRVNCETIETDGEKNGHAAILQNFTDAIRMGTPLLAPGEDGINELSLSNAAYLSSWTGDWVSLPFDAMHAAAFDAELAKRAASSRGNRIGGDSNRGDSNSGGGNGRNGENKNSRSGDGSSGNGGNGKNVGAETAAYKDKWQVNW